MKIQVTQRDISLANRRRKHPVKYWYISAHCPVALAFKRITKKMCTVGPDHAIFGERRVDLPEIASRNIYKWDMGKRMYPFTFEI